MSSPVPGAMQRRVTVVELRQLWLPSALNHHCQLTSRTKADPCDSEPRDSIEVADICGCNAPAHRHGGCSNNSVVCPMSMSLAARLAQRREWVLALRRSNGITGIVSSTISTNASRAILLAAFARWTPWSNSEAVIADIATSS